jgi:uncharacterized protein YlzI (FlbEa/FlbD family)
MKGAYRLREGRVSGARHLVVKLLSGNRFIVRKSVQKSGSEIISQKLVYDIAS